MRVPHHAYSAVWASRRVVVLWEGPVEPEVDLEVEGDPRPLDSRAGLELVREAAVAAGFAFEG
jgi:hypothetical protein